MAPKKNYSKEQMANAIEEVKRGVKIALAAAKYGVPRITLRNKITGKSPLDCTLGPATILSKDEENLLVQWLFKMSDSHFPVIKDHLLDSVQKIILEKNLESCPFKDNRPGKKWFTSFLKRHPEISERAAQNLTKARGDVSEEDLKGWFEINKKYIEDRGMSDILNDPKRIFNTDESAFYLQPKAGKVLVRKGEKNVYNSAGDEKENLTVLLTANAAGTLAPPMIVFPYERLPTLIVNSVPKDWSIGRSESGWMCARTFYEYITNVFNPWLEKHEVPKPVLFFLDGHRSHMTLHLAEFCKNNGIEIIALYPNSTHLLQPMDVSVFRPLKIFWKNQVNHWKIDHQGQRLKKEDFAPNLDKALQKVTEETIKNGFRKSGLYPFSVDYVDLAKLRQQSRTSGIHREEDTAKAFQFMTFLESEIKSVFSSEKLTLFNQLYYMNRTELENVMPEEDQSLYMIWAKVKNTLTGTESTNLITKNDSAKIFTDGQTEQQNTAQSLKENVNEPLVNRPQFTDELVSIEKQTTKHPQIIDEPQSKKNTQTQINRRQQKSDEVTQPQLIDDAQPLTLKTQSTELIQSKMTCEMQQQVTPAKNNSTHTKSFPSTSADTSITKNMNIPSPFKRALFWPEPETKKRRTKELIPSAITSDCWINYMAKKENEKKKQQEEKANRIKERQEKKAMKEKHLKEKIERVKAKKQAKKGKKKRQLPSSSSEEMDSEIEYQESEYDPLDDEEIDKEERGTVDKSDSRRHSLECKETSESESEEMPLAKLSCAMKRGKYVIIKYEGQHFPGVIENIDEGHIEVSTMTFAKNNTFRWPDVPDKIWYQKNDIVEYIQEPIAVNKRGFFKVREMEKYLTFIHI